MVDVHATVKDMASTQACGELAPRTRALNPGELAPSMRALIAGACAVSVALAALGMDSMWGVVDWLAERIGRDAFWYANGLAIAIAFAIAAAWIPRFEVSRLLRVAVLLPMIHLAAIVVAGVTWSSLYRDVASLGHTIGYGVYSFPDIAGSFSVAIVIGFGAVLAIAIAIKRRHGEWAHAAVMLTLSYLLLVGLWLPILARLSVSPPSAAILLHEQSPQYWDWWFWQVSYNHRLFSRDVFMLLAVIPPAIIALAFTATRFRNARLFARFRSWPSITVKLLLGGAIVAALTSPDESWLLYLESSYLVMFAAVLAIGALVTLTVTTRLGSLASHFLFGRMTKVEGVIALDEDEEAARFEITSWLRGPRLATRSFVVSTPYGNVPVDGVQVLAPIAASTTQLDVGDHTPLLKAGDRVVIGGRTVKGADPFRSIAGTDIAAIAAAGSRPYRFSDVTLVVWRPAVAYLAILIAIALPYLSIVLT
jgi:hypothetical protein